jgi:putative ATP-binding cassette transporter
MRRFGAVIANYLQIVDRKKKLMAFTATYGQVSPIIPYIFTAPFYFAGKIQLGVMSQTAGAFSRVEGALTFFVNYYTSLAEFKAVLDRLTSFDAAIGSARRRETGAELTRAEAPDVKLEAVTLGLPDGRRIARIDQLSLAPGQSVLLTGPSGSGKSTLFRAIAGVWPYASGRIGAPGDMMLLPQRPYLPIGPLREAVAYPGGAEAHADADIRAALEAAQLPGLAARLEESDNWQQRLSGGEQQRLALARALLAKPTWLYLDEATSALDEKTEAAVYRMLKEKLPGTTLVSIGHRSTLVDLHERRIDLEPNADGTFSPREAATTA